MPSRHVLLLVAVFPAIGATVLRRRWIKSLQADTSQNTGVSLRDPDPPSTGGPDNPFETHDPPPAIPGGAPGRGHPAPHLQSLPIIRHSTHVFPFTGDLNRAPKGFEFAMQRPRHMPPPPLSAGPGAAAVPISETNLPTNVVPYAALSADDITIAPLADAK